MVSKFIHSYANYPCVKHYVRVCFGNQLVEARFAFQGPQSVRTMSKVDPEYEEKEMGKNGKKKPVSTVFNFFIFFPSPIPLSPPLGGGKSKVTREMETAVNTWEVPRRLLLEVFRGKSYLWQNVQNKLSPLWHPVECPSLFPVRSQLIKEVQRDEKLSKLLLELEE